MRAQLPALGKWWVVGCLCFLCLMLPVRDVPAQTIVTTPSLRIGYGSLNSAIDSSLTAAVYSPDSRYLYTGSDRGVVRWDEATGHATPLYSDPTEVVRGLAISPDGTRLAVATYDRIVRMVDAASGVVLQTLPSFPDFVESLQFSSDGSFLFVMSNDTATFWSTSTYQKIREFPLTSGLVNWAVLSPDGTTFAGGWKDSSVQVWSSTDGSLVRSLPVNESVYSLAYSHDGSRLAVGGYGPVQVWDIATTSMALTLDSQGATAVAFSSTDDRLATVSQHSGVDVWRLSDGAQALHINSVGAGVGARVIPLSPDDSRLLVAGAIVQLEEYDATTGQPIRLFPGFGWGSGSFSPDGSVLFAAYPRGGLCSWDPTSGALVDQFPDSTVNTIVFANSADGNRLVTLGMSDSLRILNRSAPESPVDINFEKNFSYPIILSPDGKRLAVAFWDGTVGVWNADTGGFLESTDFSTSSFGRVLFSPDGTRLLVSHDGKIDMIWADTGQHLQTFEWDGLSGVMALSPDGTRLAAAGGVNSGNIYIWDVASAHLLKSIPGTVVITSLSYSREGRYILATNSSSILDTNATIWDLNSDQPVRRFQRKPGRVTANGAGSPGGFSPDETQIITEEGSGIIDVWDSGLPPFTEVTPTVTPAPSPTPTPAPPEIITEPIRRFGLGVVNMADLSRDETRLVTAGDTGAFVWDAATGARQLDFHGHSDILYSAAISPDGTRVVTGSLDRTTKLWDAGTGDILHNLPTNGTGARAAVFSPDGSLCLTADGYADCVIQLWNASTGELIRSFTGPQDGVYCLAFSSDGSLIASGGQGQDDFSVRIWDVATGEALHVLKGHTNLVSAVVFSPDGAFLASGSSDGTVRIWNVGAGTLDRTFTTTSTVRSVAFSPDGSQVLVGEGQGTWRIGDVSTGEWVSTTPHAREGVLRVYWDSNGPRAVTRSLVDNRVGLWNAETDELLQSFQGHTGFVRNLTFSHDGQKLLTAGLQDWIARMWDIASGTVINSFPNDNGAVVDVDISPDDSQVAGGSYYSAFGARLWDAATGQLDHVLGDITGTVPFIHYTPDGGSVLVCSSSNFPRLYDANSGELVTQYTLPGTLAAFSQEGRMALTDNRSVWVGISPNETPSRLLGKGNYWSFAHSADGHTLGIGTTVGTYLWDSLTGTVIREFPTTYTSQLAFSPDASLLVTLSPYTSGKVWNTATGELTATLPVLPASPRAVAFSPDGTRIVAATSAPDNLARVYDARTGELLLTLDSSPHTDTIYSVAFSPDGTRILTGSQDETAKLWNATTGALLFTLQSSGGPVLSVAFSPDGSKLATGESGSRTVEFWDPSTGSLISSVTQPVGAVSAVAFSPDGAQLLTGGDGFAFLWDTGSWEFSAYVKQETGTLLDLTFIDGQPVAFFSTELGAESRNVATGERVQEYRGLFPFAFLYALAISPDGSLVATGSTSPSPSNPPSIRIWDVASGDEMQVLHPPLEGGYLTSVAFSPDGSKILAAGFNIQGTHNTAAYLYDLQTGNLLKEFTGHSNWIYVAAFSPDGTLVATGSLDGTAALWDSGLPAVNPPLAVYDFSHLTGEWKMQFSWPWVAPEGLWDENNGTLVLKAMDTAPTFGYWVGPLFNLGGSTAGLSEAGTFSTDATLPDSVYTADFQVRSSVADRSRVPGVRLRINGETQQEAWFTAVESRSDGIASPDADGENYSVVFTPGPETTRARVSFDMVKFDPTDDPNGDLALRSVTITRRDPASLTDRTLLRRYTFDDGAEGWTHGAAANFDAPEFGTEPGALTISGTGSTDAFGFWSSPIGDIPAATTDTLTGDVLYMATFTVDSDVAAADRATVPQFRLRLNEDSFHASSVGTVESKGDASRSPVVGEPQQYVVYYRPPAGVQDRGLVASFDYLNFDPADNATATLKLRDVTIEAVPWPW